MKCLIKWTFFGVILYVFLMYSPTLLDFTPKDTNLPLPSFDALTENNILNDAEHLYEDLVYGPESIVFHKGDLYTGVRDGRIVKMKKDGQVTTLARTGQACVMPYEEKLCGRPLGMRVGKDDLLYIIDAYFGIYTMNFTTGALTQILSSDVEVDGRRMTLLNDLDLDDEGNVYFSDVSQKWDLSMSMYLLMDYEGKGRILKHNIPSGETTVLVQNLHFPNGVQLSKDKTSLLFSELSNRRILRYSLKGPKKGQTDVFADNLPAEPDNIRPSSRGYWVAFPLAKNVTNCYGLVSLFSNPMLRRVLGRAQHAVGSLLLWFAELTSCHDCKTFAYEVKTGKIIFPLFTKRGLVIEFNEKGEILRNFQSLDGKSSVFSEALEHKGFLYLASFSNNYVGRLKL